MPSKNKTTNLGLNQWQGNEYVKRQDFVDDNKLIDDAFGKISEEIKNIDLSSTKVIRPNKKTVEESLSANETSISNLKDKVDKGQNHKITADDGSAFKKEVGFDVFSMIDLGSVRVYGTGFINSPESGLGIFEGERFGTSYKIEATYIYSGKKGKKYMILCDNGVWSEWRSL